MRRLLPVFLLLLLVGKFPTSTAFRSLYAAAAVAVAEAMVIARGHEKGREKKLSM